MMLPGLGCFGAVGSPVKSKGLVGTPISWKEGPAVGTPSQENFDPFAIVPDGGPLVGGGRSRTIVEAHQWVLVESMLCQVKRQPTAGAKGGISFVGTIGGTDGIVSSLLVAVAKQQESAVSPSPAAVADEVVMRCSVQRAYGFGIMSDHGPLRLWHKETVSLSIASSNVQMSFCKTDCSAIRWFFRLDRSLQIFKFGKCNLRGKAGSEDFHLQFRDSPSRNVFFDMMSMIRENLQFKHDEAIAKSNIVDNMIIAGCAYDITITSPTASDPFPFEEISMLEQMLKLVEYKRAQHICRKEQWCSQLSKLMREAREWIVDAQKTHETRRQNATLALKATTEACIFKLLARYAPTNTSDLVDMIQSLKASIATAEELNRIRDDSFVIMQMCAQREEIEEAKDIIRECNVRIAEEHAMKALEEARMGYDRAEKPIKSLAVARRALGKAIAAYQRSIDTPSWSASTELRKAALNALRDAQAEHNAAKALEDLETGSSRNKSHLTSALALVDRAFEKAQHKREWFYRRPDYIRGAAVRARRLINQLDDEEIAGKRLQQILTTDPDVDQVEALELAVAEVKNLFRDTTSATDSDKLKVQLATAPAAFRELLRQAKKREARLRAQLEHCSHVAAAKQALGQAVINRNIGKLRTEIVNMRRLFVDTFPSGPGETNVHKRMEQWDFMRTPPDAVITQIKEAQELINELTQREIEEKAVEAYKSTKNKFEFIKSLDYIELHYYGELAPKIIGILAAFLPTTKTRQLLVVLSYTFSTVPHPYENFERPYKREMEPALCNELSLAAETLAIVRRFERAYKSRNLVSLLDELRGAELREDLGFSGEKSTPWQITLMRYVRGLCEQLKVEENAIFGLLESLGEDDADAIAQAINDVQNQFKSTRKCSPWSLQNDEFLATSPSEKVQRLLQASSKRVCELKQIARWKVRIASQSQQLTTCQEKLAKSLKMCQEPSSKKNLTKLETALNTMRTEHTKAGDLEKQRSDLLMNLIAKNAKGQDEFIDSLPQFDANGAIGMALAFLSGAEVKRLEQDMKRLKQEMIIERLVAVHGNAGEGAAEPDRSSQDLAATKDMREREWNRRVQIGKSGTVFCGKWLPCIKYKCEVPRSFADVVTELPSKPSRTQYVVQIAEEPFAKGNCRAAFRAKIRESTGCSSSAKEIKVILKTYLHPCYRDHQKHYFAEAETAAVAKFFAKKWMETEQGKAGKAIRFIKAHALCVTQADGRKEWFNMEEELPENVEFDKYTNNARMVKQEHPDLLKFARWSYRATDGTMMIADLQGVSSKRDYVLTDPAVLSLDSERFGATNFDSNMIPIHFQAVEKALNKAGASAYVSCSFDKQKARPCRAVRRSSTATEIRKDLAQSGSRIQSTSTPPSSSSSSSWALEKSGQWVKAQRPTAQRPAAQ